MSEGKLFEMSGEAADLKAPSTKGTPRVQHVDRVQMRLLPAAVDDYVDADHPVRSIWEMVSRLDLSALYEKVKSVEGGAGRPALDPKMLLALWVYATLEGIGSARTLAELCVTDLRFMWICGGVGVNHHSLSDFRTEHQSALDGLLTKTAAMLMQAGLASMKRVAQDGIRVRASAGTSSFRSKKRLRKFLALAHEQVDALKAELDQDPGAESRRLTARRERVGHERAESIAHALEQMKIVEANAPQKKKGKKSKDKGELSVPRVSTTDPEARVMKMADGGYRPALNVQLATDPKTQVILGVAVSNVGSDMSQMEPMLEQLEQRYGAKPEEYLVDGGYAKKEAIEALTAKQVTVYAPVQKPKDAARDAHEPRADDSEAIAAWRKRMGTEQGQEIYRERAETECANAQMRNRGLKQFLVRGINKALSVVLLYALAQNIARAIGFGVLG